MPGLALLLITLAKLFLHDLEQSESALSHRRVYRCRADFDCRLVSVSALPRAELPRRRPLPEFALSQLAVPLSRMSENRRVSTRATGVVGIAILCSRILGLLREVVFASLFGASKNMDAFLTAFRAPNMLRDLFAEGALSTAFVTTFSQRIATEGDQSAWRLASKVATLTIVFMSAITLLGIIFAPGVDSRAGARVRAGQSGAHDLAHAHHVSVHSARLARGAASWEC